MTEEKIDYPAKKSIIINAPVARVWNALTDPNIIKQYFFGTEVITDWKVGSQIIWKGVWEGKTYQDKGKILNFLPEKIIELTYWSSMGGLEDKPQNYKKIKYKVTQLDQKTKLAITQENNPTIEIQKHSEKNWGMVLQSLKDLLEK